MCFSAVNLEHIATGIDWHNEKILFRGEKRLSDVDLKKYYRFREEYLKKNSNLVKIQQRKTLVAEFKKEKKSCKDVIEAVSWLVGKAEENI